MPDTFQSTHPHGVRQGAALILHVSFQFQSTHPHGVRHLVVPFDVHIFFVSIHAPTWGATGADYGSRISSRSVSIHAPTWGATPLI